MPNLGQDASFYDPGTRKLRKPFEMYPEALQATYDSRMIGPNPQQLLKRIRPSGIARKTHDRKAD